MSGGPAGVWRWRGDALLLDLDGTLVDLSVIDISEPTRQEASEYAVVCVKK